MTPAPRIVRSSPRYAVLTMDIEDWYHLDYFAGMSLGTTPSLLDGLEVYCDVLAQYGIKSTFFVLADIAQQVAGTLRALHGAGHDIGCHGLDHVRPLTIATDDFFQRISRARAQLQDLTGCPILGHRASCFSMDRERLEAVRRAGFGFDSSKIAFGDHPLYGDLDMTGFTQPLRNAYLDGEFAEFEVSTLPVAGRMVPVSGGGYLRMFPWSIMRRAIHRYAQNAELYVLYIHPFELSPAPSPLRGQHVPWKPSLRFSLGRGGVRRKLIALIELLRQQQFEFTTFAALRARLLEDA